MASGDGNEPNDHKTESAATPSPPLRQDQVQNAVAFLQHPKVRDSSEESKRSFLERKGLTSAEIDAAFVNVKNGGGGNGYQVEQPLPSASQTPSPYSWSKAFMGVTVIAAGIFALQKYAFPWVREWTKRRTAGEDAPSTSQIEKWETHQELKRYCGSMERSMQEMTMEIRTLCSKIDILALEARRDSQQRDIQEIKLLLNGLAEAPPSAPMSPGTRNPLWTPGVSPRSVTPNIGQASFGNQVSCPSGLEGGISEGPGHDEDSNQAEYMNVLGLLANGKNLSHQQGGQDTEQYREFPSNAPPNSWGAPASNGGTAGGVSQASIGEIQPESDSGVAESTHSQKDGPVQTSAGFGSNGWTPPALPEATINMSPEKKLEET